ncbi:DEAD/DEAH box helicase [Halobaculum sp. MBLA0143]|uniref:DEAD/DEAH box helicase n=1 Tax=Halobaculum sp. MBLA0143 TaxID=3079933 RepID=UPI003525D3C4
MLETDRNVEELWPPQVEALNSGLTEDENFLVVSGAGTGKTLLAELAMVDRSLKQRGCSVFLVPFKPLAREKQESFESSLSGDLQLNVTCSVGDDQVPPRELFGSDVAILTYEKFSYYLRNYSEESNDQIHTVVVDEFQMLGDETRGPTLEIVISKILHSHDDTKLVGLSATASNGGEIAEWIDGEYVDCRGWRPNPLYEGIHAVRDGETTFYYDGTRQETHDERTQSLVDNNDRYDAIANYLHNNSVDNQQILVFAPTRNDAEEAAGEIRDLIEGYPRSYNFEIDDTATDELKQRIKRASRDGGQTLDNLAKCAKWGTAFYHAGLDPEIRSIVEEGFKNGVVRLLASTSNLGAGINLPVDRVFVLHPRFGGSKYGTQMSTADYKNLAGRAGRPSSSRRGESILFAEDFRKEQQLKNTYVLGELESIESQVEITSDLSLMLDLIREYRTPTNIHSFLQDTFIAHRKGIDEKQTREAVDFAADKLRQHGMIDEAGDGLTLTGLGKETSKNLVEPETVATVRSYLESVRNEAKIDTSDLLTVLCGTPEFRHRRLYTSQRNLSTGVSELTNEYGLQSLSDREVAKSRISARVVADWLSGDSIETAFERYSISDTRSAADVYQRLAPEMSRVLGTVLRILEASDSDLYDAVSDVSTLVTQLRHGVDREGIPFFDAGIVEGRSELRELRNKLDIEAVAEIADLDFQKLDKRMKTRNAVQVKRRAVNAVYEGREAARRDVLLDVHERGLSEGRFERLLNSDTSEFENTAVSLLEYVDEMFVEPADESGRTEEPECRVKIRQPDGTYLETSNNETMEIGFECKSKEGLEGKVATSDATAIVTKAPETTVQLTVATPGFTEGTDDALVDNDVAGMTAVGFAAFVARAINGDLSANDYRTLLEDKGIVELSTIRSVVDD